METDVPISGYTAAGSDPTPPANEGTLNDQGKENITGYLPTGGAIPEEGPTLQGYEATGAEPVLPGLTHVPNEPKETKCVLCGLNLADMHV